MTTLWQGVAGLILALLLALGVQSCRVDRLQDKLAAKELSLAKERTAAADALVKKQNEMNTLARQAQTTQAKADEEYETLTTELRTAKRKLRDRFTCPIPNGSSGGDGGEARGLLGTDAEFLISEAKRADDITRQLQLAQKVIRAYEQDKK